MWHFHIFLQTPFRYEKLNPTTRQHFLPGIFRTDHLILSFVVILWPLLSSSSVSKTKRPPFFCLSITWERPLDCIGQNSVITTKLAQQFFCLICLGIIINNNRLINKTIQDILLILFLTEKVFWKFCTHRQQNKNKDNN